MPDLFSNFLNERFVASNQKIHKMTGKQPEMSYSTFRDKYLESVGFKEWLETLRGHSLSLAFCIDTAKTYHTMGNRPAAEIPTILAMLTREYNIQWDVEEGLYTPEYWEAMSQRHYWCEQKLAEKAA